jgi:hypothetical protein
LKALASFDWQFFFLQPIAVSQFGTSLDFSFFLAARNIYGIKDFFHIIVFGGPQFA